MKHNMFFFWPNFDNRDIMKLKNVYFTDLFRKYVKFKCNLFISFKLKKKTKKNILTVTQRNY